MPHFQRTDQARLLPGLNLITNLAPPKYEKDQWAGFPATACFTMSTSGLHRMQTRSVECQHMVWASRHLIPDESGEGFDKSDRANDRFGEFMADKIYIGARECRPRYTTEDAAEAATFVDVAHACGYEDVVIQSVAAGGNLPVFTWQEAEEAKHKLFTEVGDAKEFFQTPAGRDVAILPMEQAGSTYEWIVLDTEIQSEKDPDRLLEFLGNMAKLCHRREKKLCIWPNELMVAENPDGSGVLPGAGAWTTGFRRSNLAQIVDAVDRLCVKVWARAGRPVTRQAILDAFHAQLDHIEAQGPVDRSKIALNVGLGSWGTDDETLLAAETIREIIESDEISREVYLWKYWQTLGSNNPNHIMNRFIETAFLNP